MSEEKVTVEISKKTLEFLKNLNHELETQSTRGTARPILFSIMQTKIVFKPDGCGEPGYFSEGCLMSDDCWADDVYDYLQEEDDIKWVSLIVLKKEIEKKEEEIELKKKTEKKEEKKEEKENPISKLIFSWMKKFPYEYEEFQSYYAEDRYTYVYYEREEQVDSFSPNIFLTEKAIKAHIKQNHYHYHNPKSYVSDAWRNYEIEGLLGAVKEIAEFKQEEK